jgi:hypothetical protein
MKAKIKGLTRQEKKVMRLLAEAHNIFVKLPVQFKDDAAEWAGIINYAHRIVQSRVAVRTNPKIHSYKEK